VFSIFAKFKCFVENLLSCTIKTIQVDGGTEFLLIIRSYPAIQFHIFCPYTPQQNGLVERKHHHIVELSLATMFSASIPQSYWPEIFESVTFIVNKLSSSYISFDSPFHTLFDTDPDYSFFKILGCKCFPYTIPYYKNKLSPRSISCVRCLDLANNKVYFSRHIVFDEILFHSKLNLLLSPHQPLLYSFLLWL
jgi:hypothetical protein